jgi:hypothetical protein
MLLWGFLVVSDNEGDSGEHAFRRLGNGVASEVAQPVLPLPVSGGAKQALLDGRIVPVMEGDDAPRLHAVLQGHGVGVDAFAGMVAVYEDEGEVSRDVVKGGGAAVFDELDRSRGPRDDGRIGLPLTDGVNAVEFVAGVAHNLHGGPTPSTDLDSAHKSVRQRLQDAKEEHALGGQDEAVARVEYGGDGVDLGAFGRRCRLYLTRRFIDVAGEPWIARLTLFLSVHIHPSSNVVVKVLPYCARQLSPGLPGYHTQLYQSVLVHIHVWPLSHQNQTFSGPLSTTQSQQPYS